MDEVEALSRQVYIANRLKSQNYEIYDVVDKIHSAVHQNKQISFHYYEYNNEKNCVLRNKGERYQFSPYGLTWEDNRYYAIGFSVKHDKIVTFRAYRMSCVEIADCPCIPKSQDFDIGEFVKQTFRMYDAALFLVTLKCKNEIMNIFESVS